MVRKTLAAAASAVALSAACGAAHAQVLVELEGPIEAYNGYGPGGDKILSVMGIPVIVDESTLIYSPSAVKSEVLDGPPSVVNGKFNLYQWFKNDFLPGRKKPGFLGGTAIVLGTFDPDYVALNSLGDPIFTEPGAIFPDEVFMEPAENVVLGQVTDSLCTTALCDAANIDSFDDSVDLYLDWLRVNAGVYVVPVFDKRMPAGPMADELGFHLDLTGQSLVGREVGVEGYFGDKNTPVDLESDGLLNAGAVEENVRALHYFHLELSGADAALLADKENFEVAVSRIDCVDGDELELRGGVHSPVNPDGSPIGGGATPVGNTRVIRVYLPDGTLFSQSAPADILPFGDAAGGVVINDPFGEYRLRDRTVPFCPPVVDIEWVDLQDLNNPLARIEDIEVEITL